MYDVRLRRIHLLLFGAMLLEIAASIATAATATQPPMILGCPAGAGTVGVADSSSLVASGGVSPYQFSISAGALPLVLTVQAP